MLGMFFGESSHTSVSVATWMSAGPWMYPSNSGLGRLVARPGQQTGDLWQCRRCKGSLRRNGISTMSGSLSWEVWLEVVGWMPWLGGCYFLFGGK